MKTMKLTMPLVIRVGKLGRLTQKSMVDSLKYTKMVVVEKYAQSEDILSRHLGYDITSNNGPRSQDTCSCKTNGHAYPKADLEDRSTASQDKGSHHLGYESEDDVGSDTSGDSTPDYHWGYDMTSMTSKAQIASQNLQLRSLSQKISHRNKQLRQALASKEAAQHRVEKARARKIEFRKRYPNQSFLAPELQGESEELCKQVREAWNWLSASREEELRVENELEGDEKWRDLLDKQTPDDWEVALNERWFAENAKDKTRNRSTPD
ncbi:hypothetical protein P280DRAFT_520125 [Massarina eburnea CBS 473.64]|uniref:Uncharacterized protein n=1 Tax=Massarina eburnea CBS 473.64 TaxID=1395130 RepID=A0A6A6RU04_9PLEO|nr:hypothetical protein P280DRAFT_520125 [Massarina eburnea CBS 473.64]